MKRFQGGIAAALVVALAACAPTGGGEEATAQALEPGEILLEDAHGGRVRWSEYDGQIRLVNFWATWCPPCTVEIPHFNAIAEEYRDRGVQVLGVSLDATADEVRSFEREVPLNYPSLMSTPELIGRVGPILGVPTTYVLDREGKVFNQHVGLTHRKFFEEDVEKLLAAEAEGARPVP